MPTTANGFSPDPEKHPEPIPGLDEAKMRSGTVVPEEILKHSHDADEALKAFASFPGEVVRLDEETGRRLLRKIDWHIMPVSCLFLGGWKCESAMGDVHSDGFNSCCVLYMD
jgi:hypothetical protein